MKEEKIASPLSRFFRQLHTVKILILHVCMIAFFILSGCEEKQMEGPRDEIFISSHNTVSDRYAILEVDESSGWFYLTASGTQKPEKDCFVFTRIEPVEELNIEAVKKTGVPPVLTKKIASSSAWISDITEDGLSIVWSSDGESVVIKHKGDPLAMILAAEERGYSKALSLSSFFGEPWEDAKYKVYFE